MSERLDELDKFVKNLSQSRFDRIFDKKEELESFYIFLRNRAIPAGGYAVSFPISEGGLVWFLYQIRDVKERRGKLLLDNKRTVLVPTDPSDRSIPEECSGYPVWFLENLLDKR